MHIIYRSDDTVVLRISPKERGHLVIQIGTSDADRAVQVAKMVSMSNIYKAEGIKKPGHDITLVFHLFQHRNYLTRSKEISIINLQYL